MRRRRSSIRSSAIDGLLRTDANAAICSDVIRLVSFRVVITRGAFEAHHVVERAKGGRTKLRNLARLCWLHHRMVHLHRLVLTLHPDRSLTVTTADGHPIDRPIAVTDFNVDAPQDPNRLGGWSGQQMDLPYVVATVLGG